MARQTSIGCALVALLVLGAVTDVAARCVSCVLR